MLMLNHWSLATIYRPKGADSETTTIFLMDSLKFHDTEHTFGLTESFLKDALDIHDEITRKIVEVPDQGGKPDCAFFSLYNIQKIITQVSDELPFEEIVKLGPNWYAPEDASALREETVLTVVALLPVIIIIILAAALQGLAFAYILNLPSKPKFFAGK